MVEVVEESSNGVALNGGQARIGHKRGPLTSERGYTAWRVRQGGVIAMLEMPIAIPIPDMMPPTVQYYYSEADSCFTRRRVKVVLRPGSRISGSGSTSRRKEQEKVNSGIA